MLYPVQLPHRCMPTVALALGLTALGLGLTVASPHLNRRPPPRVQHPLLLEEGRPVGRLPSPETRIDIELDLDLIVGVEGLKGG
jgi:hypothetical protein